MASRTRLRRSRYRLRPVWMTTRRLVAVVALAAVVFAGVFAYRTAAGLASIFHTNVGSVVGSLIKGKSGSTIETDQVANLQRIHIALYRCGRPRQGVPSLP